jgi:hypothetical protein
MRSGLFVGNLLEIVLESRRNHTHFLPHPPSQRLKIRHYLRLSSIARIIKLWYRCAIPFTNSTMTQTVRILTHTPGSFQTPIQKKTATM